MTYNPDWIAVNNDLAKIFNGFGGKCPNCDSPLKKSIVTTCERKPSDKDWTVRVTGKLVCSNPECHFDEVVADRKTLGDKQDQ